MDNTNAERQRSYIAKLKAAAKAYDKLSEENAELKRGDAARQDVGAQAGSSSNRTRQSHGLNA